VQTGSLKMLERTGSPVAGLNTWF